MANADVLEIMSSHSGAEGAVCCHHNLDALPNAQYETLSTVILGLETGELKVLPGGPCGKHNKVAAAA